MSDKMAKEFIFFLKNKSENESGGPVNRKDMSKWIINFDGPKNSDYEGGKFHVEVNFPQNYPEDKPKCKFLNEELLHPNIRQDGTVCFGKLKWDKNNTILDIINALYYLLKYPNFGDGYDNKQVKDFYEADPESYHRTVREIVKEFSQK